MNAARAVAPSIQYPRWVAADAGPYRRLVLAIGFACILLLPLWFIALLFPNHTTPGSSLVVVPLLTMAQLIPIAILTRKDDFLRLVLPVGLLFKLAAAGAFLQASFSIFGEGGDMYGYYWWGNYLVNFGWDPFPGWTTGHLVQVLSGATQTVLGTELPSTTVAFAFIAYWGQYLCYRAFCIGYPGGNRRLAAVLLFFWPSLIFWTSFIGKDALMLLFIGMTVYGFARLQQSSVAGAVPLALGLIGAADLRPHIGGMLALCLMTAHVYTRPRGRSSGVLLKAVTGVILAAGTFYLVSQAREFVNVTDVASGVEKLNGMHQDLSSSGSGFSSSMAVNLMLSPFFFARPFPWEVHSPQVALASLESVGLLLLLFSRRCILTAFRFMVRSPLALMAGLFVAGFSLIFSLAMGNFGTMVRERTMALPFLLMAAASAIQIKRKPVSPLPRI